MVKSNPFTIIFGMEPQSEIPRKEEFNKVVMDFESPVPSTLGYVITGVRGCGKTVLMSSIQNHFSKNSAWYVLRLNPDLDLFSSAISQLTEFIHPQKEMISEISVSIAGFGGGFATRSLSDNENLLRKLLKAVSKEKKRVLIVIDEASNTKNLRTFSHSFQAFIGEKLPVFLLMTALPENFSALSNSKNGTFLRRLPRIKLQGLSPILIEEKYSQIFSVPLETAIEFSKTVMGYPYAFQLLGAILWDQGKKQIDEKVLSEYDAMLYDGSYKAIWDRLTEKGRLIIRAIAHSSSSSVKEIREECGMESNQFSPYREGLKENGLILTDSYGKIFFALPRFREFVIRIEQYYIS